MASASTSTTNPVADVRPEAAGEEVSLKRKKNEAEWKKNVAKARKNSGKEYISRSTGKVMAARRVRDFYQYYTPLNIPGCQTEWYEY